MKFRPICLLSFRSLHISLLLAILSILVLTVSSPTFLWADPTAVSICDDPNYPHNAIWEKYCGGGSAQQQASPSQAQIEENQRDNDARDLNQKGMTAFQNEAYETAEAYFVQALDKTPNDSAIQQNLQNVREKIEARNKFKREQNEALNDLKGSAGDSDSGLKGGDEADTGFKDINSSEDSKGHAAAQSTSGHTASWVNNDPNVVDLRGLKNPTIDPSKLKEVSDTAAGKLVKDPGYRDALNEGVSAYQSGSATEKSAAMEKIRELGEVAVYPRDRFMDFLFNIYPDKSAPKASTKAAESKILNGFALPDADEVMNGVLKAHPKLEPQLLALWNKTCRQRIKIEDAEMTTSVQRLSQTVTRLGLPYGHIEETADKDSHLRAQWRAAVLQVTADNETNIAKAQYSAIRQFNHEARKLSEAADSK